MAQTSPSPLLIEISSANGHYLTDAQGNKYLDLISGISVCNLGHSHPKIIEAITAQAREYMHTMVYGEFVLSPQVKLAQRLSSLLPATLNSCYFLNSGSEAAEGAMKLAKRHTGRHKFIAFEQAYHGSTHGALSLMSNEYFTAPFRPLLPGIRFIKQNYFPDLAKIDCETAAVIIELVQAEKGAIPTDLDFLIALRNQCNKTGTLLIFDEIQTGMGRTGSLFAFEKFGVIPDILLLGKAFGGGMPLAAFIASKEMMADLSNNPVLGHITTFGGHPVSCAAALVALNLTVEGMNSFKIEEKENFIRAKAKELELGAISGKGLLLSLDLGTENECRRVIDYCMTRGVFTDWFLFAPEKLRIAPPLSITLEELEFALKTIAKAMKN